MNDTNLIEDLHLLSPSGYGGWWVLVLAGALACGVFLLMRHGTRSSLIESAATADPEFWNRVLNELDRLTPFLSREHSREYAIRSTDIIRRYIEMRYGLRAPKLATEEFLTFAGDGMALPVDHRTSLRRFLELCDLLKFGRYVAPAAELEPLHAAAVAFVLASRPASPAKASPERSA